MTVAGETHRCPPHEVLAAFVDARLPKTQVVALSEHLATCAECRFVVESASELQAEEEEESIEPRRGRAWRWLSVAAVVSVGVLLTPVTRAKWQAHVLETDKQKLVEAMTLKVRLIEPRLAGFVRRAAPPTYRGPKDGGAPDVMAPAVREAYELLEDTKNDRSADAAHARGIACLVIRSADQAIAEFATAIQKQPDNAQAWSDLSAAYIQNHQSKEAIDAANRAIALDPKLNEARFNRALATYNPDKPAESIREWNDYLKHDPKGPWAEEAKRKIDNNLP